MNPSKLQERFFKEKPKMRLGHLASDLARIAFLLGKELEKETVESVMNESKFFAEWAAQDVDPETQILLAEIQGCLAQWELEWSSLSANIAWKNKTARILRTWSDELLKRAGFFDSDERS